MARITIWFSVLLILVGLGAYFGSGRVSATALIPAFLGLPLLLAGVLALQERFRMHAMHAAAVIALLGFIGSVRGLVVLIQAIAGSPIDRPTAVTVQSITAVLCAIFLFLCVQSFIEARRQRKAA